MPALARGIPRTFGTATFQDEFEKHASAFNGKLNERIRTTTRPLDLLAEIEELLALREPGWLGLELAQDLAVLRLAYLAEKHGLTEKVLDLLQRLSKDERENIRKTALASLCGLGACMMASVGEGRGPFYFWNFYVPEPNALISGLYPVQPTEGYWRPGKRMGMAALLRDTAVVADILADMVRGDSVTGVRRLGVEGCRMVQDPRLVEPLIGALSDPNEGVRFEAALSLPFFSGRGIGEALLRAMESEPSANVRGILLEKSLPSKVPLTDGIVQKIRTAYSAVEDESMRRSAVIASASYLNKTRSEPLHRFLTEVLTEALDHSKAPGRGRDWYGSERAVYEIGDKGLAQFLPVLEALRRNLAEDHPMQKALAGSIERLNRLPEYEKMKEQLEALYRRATAIMKDMQDRKAPPSARPAVFNQLMEVYSDIARLHDRLRK